LVDLSRVRKAPIEVEFGTIHHADCWVPKPLSQTAHKRKKTMKTLVIFSFFAALGMAQSSLPSRALTPGAVIRGVSARDVCVVGYSHRIRNVPIAEKRRVYGEYNLEYVKGADEVDHLIPLELGGSNSIKNLWPQPYGILWNAHAKDALEDKLHEQVCYEGLPLESAQRMIADNWIEAYKRVFGVDSPQYIQHVRRRRRRAK
jgi:hypothetical protein